jgi:hypothetical protein
MTFSKRPADWSKEIEAFANSKLPADSPLRSDIPPKQKADPFEAVRQAGEALKSTGVTSKQ